MSQLKIGWQNEVRRDVIAEREDERVIDSVVDPIFQREMSGFQIIDGPILNLYATLQTVDNGLTLIRDKIVQLYQIMAENEEALQIRLQEIENNTDGLVSAAIKKTRQFVRLRADEVFIKLDGIAKNTVAAMDHVSKETQATIDIATDRPYRKRSRQDVRQNDLFTEQQLARREPQQFTDRNQQTGEITTFWQNKNGETWIEVAQPPNAPRRWREVPYNTYPFLYLPPLQPTQQ